MKKTEQIMGMPITIEILDKKVKKSDFSEVFDFFEKVDKQFSPFKDSSEVSDIDKGGRVRSDEMKEVLKFADQTKRESIGFFNVWQKGKFDPSGIVKGWAIKKATEILKEKGFKNFYINAGGDIQTAGLKNGKKWKVGIKNPFNKKEIVKIVNIKDKAIATSGTYEKGNHIYNPLNGENNFDILSLTVVANDILEADRFATAAFAMGKSAIHFLENRNDLEGYMIDNKGIATMTSGFKKFE